MRIETLHVQHSPGLPEGLASLTFPSGLVVIHGPNGSGKTTVARAIRELLWPGLEPTGSRLESRWRSGDQDHVSALFAGRVDWSPALQSSPLAAAAPLARFGLRTLLQHDDSSDLGIAGTIRKELAGGLDLDEAMSVFDSPEWPRTRGGSVTRYREALKKKASAIQVARDLADQETRLSELALRIDQARSAGGYVQSARILTRLIDCTVELRALQSVEFDPRLDRIRGDEIDRIEAKRVTMHSLGENHARLLLQIRSFEKQMDDMSFGTQPPQQAIMDAWLERLDQAADLMAESRRLRQDHANAEAARGAACEMLFGIEEGSLPSKERLEELGEITQRRLNSEALATAADQRVRTWSSMVPDEPLDSVVLNQSINGMRAWLRAGEFSRANSVADRFSEHPVLGSLGIVLGIGVGVVAFLMDAFVFWVIGWLCPVMLVMGYLLVRRSSVQDNDDRAFARREVDSTGIGPDAWNRSTVEQLLRAQERDLVRAIQSDSVRSELDSAKHDQEVAHQEMQDSIQAMESFAQTLGLSRTFVALQAGVQIAALQAWVDSSAACSGHAAALEANEAQLLALLEDCNSWLQTIGSQSAVDIVEAKSQVRSISNRLANWSKLGAQLGQAQDEMAILEREVALASKSLSELWSGLELEVDDDRGLEKLMEAHGRWRTNQEEQHALRREIDSFRIEFDKSPTPPGLIDTDPLEVSPDQVAEWIVTYELAADQLESLVGQRAQIEERLARARSGCDMQDAVAQLQHAEESNARSRDQAFEDAVARLMLEEARKQAESRQATPVLARARDRFSRFTHGEWRLEIDREEGFKAFDVRGQQLRSLEALSDGTRIQLLLAVRLAALEHMESGGEPLPLCLDEALATTDAARFEAIASVILDLVNEGRQVLYFTADHGEVAQWQQACRRLGGPDPTVIDLLRGSGSTSWSSELPAWPRLAEMIPPPGEQTAEEYRSTIDVPLPDPLQPPESWHLFMVSGFDLSALHLCLQHRISSIGQWREVVAAHSLPDIPQTSRIGIDARIRLAMAMASAWGIGRPGLLTWHDIKSSGAITDRYEEDVRSLLLDHERDASAFMEGVGGISGFRRSQRDRLHEHLVAEGVLPTVEPLDEEALLRRALSSAQDAVEAIGGPDVAANYLLWILKLLEESDLHSSTLGSEYPGI